MMVVEEDSGHMLRKTGSTGPSASYTHELTEKTHECMYWDPVGYRITSSIT